MTNASQTSMAPPPQGHELEAVCVICDELIADGDGVLYCDQFGRVTTQWFAVHFRCYPGSHFRERGYPEEIGPYSISVERIRTYHHLAWWTYHVYFGKGWGPETDWRNVIASALGRKPGPLRPARQMPQP